MSSKKKQKLVENGSEKASSEETADEALILRRKKDHIDICLKKPIETALDNPVWSTYRLPFVTLPNLNLEEIDLRCKYFSWDISFPFVVSSMTGGEAHGRTINEAVARACEAENVPFGLGSMRCTIRHPETVHTFNVKDLAPSVPMFANVGVVQLNYGFSEVEFKRIIESVKADGLFIHVNAMQEVVQPEGDTNFSGLVPKLKDVLAKLKPNFPVVVKEVGHGFDRVSAQRLRDIGITHLDVAGVGGSSWAWIEGYRQRDYEESNNLGFLLRDVGYATDESLEQCRSVEGLTLIAGGGIRSGLDLCKALMMGASYGTCAKPFLAAALVSSEAVQLVLQRFKKELRAAMFAVGAKNIEELRKLSLIKKK